MSVISCFFGQKKRSRLEPVSVWPPRTEHWKIQKTISPQIFGWEKFRRQQHFCVTTAGLANSQNRKKVGMKNHPSWNWALHQKKYKPNSRCKQTRTKASRLPSYFLSFPMLEPASEEALRRLRKWISWQISPCFVCRRSARGLQGEKKCFFYFCFSGS